MWSLPIWSGFLPLQAGLLSSATAACPINYIENIRKARLGIPAVQLPSTSPANAAWNLERLSAAWGEVLLPLLEEGEQEEKESQ